MNQSLYNQFNQMWYLYRFILHLKGCSRDSGLLLSAMLRNRALHRLYSAPVTRYDFSSEQDIEIASKIASGVLMDDWIGQKVATGMLDIKSLRQSWVRVALIISTYLTKADFADIDPGSLEQPNYQSDIPEIVKLQF